MKAPLNFDAGWEALEQVCQTWLDTDLGEIAAEAYLVGDDDDDHDDEDEDQEDEDQGQAAAESVWPWFLLSCVSFVADEGTL